LPTFLKSLSSILISGSFPHPGPYDEKGNMKYVVHKLAHRENVRLLTGDEPEDSPIIFEGENAKLLACDKARELKR
jgi:hypothetical protein